MTRRLATAWTLAAICSFASGCGSLSGGRIGMADRARTTATSGGSRLQVGSDLEGRAVAELGDPQVRGRAGGQIIGRVIDQNGRPVPRAEVRLADGSARAGRDLRALTDESGGFTLRGLRPGAAYTLVARGDDDRPTLVGRTSARAPSGNVRIRLHEDEETTVAAAEPTDPEPEPAPARRVGRVSEREEVDEPLNDEPRSDPRAKRAARVNDDDIPPADEVDERRDEPVGEGEAAKPRAKGVAWQGTKQAPESAAIERPTKASTPEPVKPVEPTPEDDGPNPLPPAKERPAPSVAPTAPPDLNPPPAEAPAPVSSEPPPAPASAPEQGGATVESASIPVQAPQSRRATWADIAAAPDLTPSGSSLPISTRRVSASEPEADAPASKPGPDRARSGLLGFGKPKMPEPATLPPLSVAPASCRFDAREQRILDFQLPDLHGNPVHLRDIDSDYVLLDFWGTWCGPCRESIPHLIDLQSRYRAKNLRVVGVATEHDATPAERARRVETTAKSLGVNYPLLLSEAEGKPCPLQEALHVQAYPTLILLDRSGKIVWRGTGAEGMTLARLDRIIAAQAGVPVLRR